MFDFEVIWQYMPRILHGALLTVEIGVLSVLCAIMIGLIGALMRLSGSVVLASIAGAYSTIVRAVPDLIWMLMVITVRN